MPRAARFAAAMTTVTRRLPFGLAGIVAPSVVGYLLINLCTFFLDLGLLALFFGGLRWPLPLAVTLSYGTAGMVSYVANRALNFRSHGAVGRQLPIYLLVMTSNYLIFVLGLTNGLHALGVYFELARVIAATCEAVYLYCCMRWIVFRDARDSAFTPAKPAKSAAEPAKLAAEPAKSAAEPAKLAAEPATHSQPARPQPATATPPRSQAAVQPERRE
jgi:putative flippase GtrA